MMVSALKNRPLSICALLVIGVLTITSCSKPKSSYDYLNQARQEHEKGNNQAAIIDLKNALKKDSKNGEARLLFAQILNEQGDGSHAEIEVRKAIGLGVNKSFAAATLGKALLLQRQYQKVINNIETSDDDKGKVAADIYNVRGDAYLSLKKVDDAKSAFEAALKEYPDSADAYLGLARLAATTNNLDEALHRIDSALSKDPNSTKALLMKAKLLRVQDKGEDARAAYNHILQLDKSNVAARLGLATLDLAQKKLDAAKTEVDAAVKLAPKDLAVIYTLGLVEFQRGEFKEAQDSVQQVLKSAPDYPPAILLSGAVGFALGSFEQALNDLNRVVAQYPGDAYARRLLAATHLKLGETDQAMNALEPLLKPDVGDAQALALAGEAQLKIKNFTRASEYLQKALEINPNADKIQAQLGLSYLGAGETEQGMRELEAAARQTPGQSPADMILIVRSLQDKDYDQALAAIARLEKKTGSNPVTLNLRGSALIGKQDLPEARKDFEQALAIQPTYFPAAMNLARLDLREEKYDMARKRFEAILEKDKNNVQAMMALAQLALIEKKESDYVGWLEKAIKANADAVEPRVGLIRYYLANKEYQKALALAKDAVGKYPNSFEALKLLGLTQLGMGDKATAVTTFTNMTQKAPRSPEAFQLLAVAQLADKQTEAARSTLNKALELKPDFIDAQDSLMRLDMERHKFDAALHIAREIQAQRPREPLGFDREADIELLQKHYPQAIKAYEQALAKGAGSTGIIKLHQALSLSGDQKTAEQKLAAWFKQHPGDRLVRAYAAHYYLTSNRNREAIAQYQELLKTDSKNIVYLNNLAILYQREKDSRALATAEQALKLAPENPGMQDTAGWILVDQGQVSRGLKLLEKAVTQVPNEPTIRYHYGVALARAGKKAEAKKALEAAIDSGQKFPELEDAKAMLKTL